MKIETRGSKRQCALCLTSCGLGLKRIASMLGTVHPAVYRWRKDAGISGMIGPRMGYGVVKGSKAYRTGKPLLDAFMAEQSECRRWNGEVCWSKHREFTAERNRGNARKTWHANKHDPEFRQKKKLARDDWARRNRDRLRDVNRKWAENNPDKMMEYKEKAKARVKDPATKTRIASNRSKWRKLPKNRCLISVRNRLRDVLECKHSSSCVKLTGVSASVLRDHIASQFKRGMTWDNYGKHWHVDHIVPCAAFDMTRPDEVKRCFHFTNLQPLEAKKNIAKGCKFNPSTIELPMAY